MHYPICHEFTGHSKKVYHKILTDTSVALGDSSFLIFISLGPSFCCWSKATSVWMASCTDWGLWSWGVPGDSRTSIGGFSTLPVLTVLFVLLVDCRTLLVLFTDSLPKLFTPAPDDWATETLPDDVKDILADEPAFTPCCVPVLLTSDDAESKRVAAPHGGFDAPAASDANETVTSTFSISAASDRVWVFPTTVGSDALPLLSIWADVVCFGSALWLPSLDTGEDNDLFLFGGADTGEGGLHLPDGDLGGCLIYTGLSNGSWVLSSPALAFAAGFGELMTVEAEVVEETEDEDEVFLTGGFDWAEAEPTGSTMTGVGLVALNSCRFTSAVCLVVWWSFSVKKTALLEHNSLMQLKTQNNTGCLKPILKAKKTLCLYLNL